MQLNKLLLVGSIVGFLACNNTQTRYEHALALLDPAQKLDIENLEQFQAIVSDCHNFSAEQVDELRTHLSDYQLALAEEAAEHLEYQLDSMLHADEINTVATDSVINSYAFYNNYGINIFMYEGEVSANIKPTYEAMVFKHYLSDCEKALSQMLQREVDTPSTIDEAIVIDYPTINNRLANYDQLTAQYANDPLHPIIEVKRKEYLALLMYGTDNTPAFDWDTRTIKAETLNAIKDYVQQHPRLKSASTLESYLSLLEANGGRRNDTIDIFISSTFPAN